MSDIIIYTWIVCLGIVMLYEAFFVIQYLRLENEKLKGLECDPLPMPMVSIVIAVKNDADKLSLNWSAIAYQDYPQFEIIVIDDHSDEEHALWLTAIVGVTSHASLIQNTGSGKKNAITTGIRHARGEYILVTDADCRPVSNEWIATMVGTKFRHDVVLGYSPYKQTSGWLNRFVQFETSMTAIQYMSWALAGRPYMGVGRNMLYRKEVFEKTEPYRDDHVPFGDDDLFVQKISSPYTAHVCTAHKSFVETQPPASYREWWRQKHRHMSAAANYTIARWWQPGIFGMAMIMVWVLFIPLCFIWPVYGILLFVTGLWLRSHVFDVWSKESFREDLSWFYAVMEFKYMLYLLVMGIYSLVKTKKTWN